jgi:hypothetical protein
VDKINALAQNAAFAIALGGTTPTIFWRFQAGTWLSGLGFRDLAFGTWLSK